MTNLFKLILAGSVLILTLLSCAFIRNGGIAELTAPATPTPQTVNSENHVDTSANVAEPSPTPQATHTPTATSGPDWGAIAADLQTELAQAQAELDAVLLQIQNEEMTKQQENDARVRAEDLSAAVAKSQDNWNEYNTNAAKRELELAAIEQQNADEHAARVAMASAEHTAYIDKLYFDALMNKITVVGTTLLALATGIAFVGWFYLRLILNADKNKQPRPAQVTRLEVQQPTDNGSKTTIQDWPHNVDVDLAKQWARSVSTGVAIGYDYWIPKTAGMPFSRGEYDALLAVWQREGAIENVPPHGNQLTEIGAGMLAAFGAS